MFYSIFVKTYTSGWISNGVNIPNMSQKRNNRDWCGINQKWRFQILVIAILLYFSWKCSPEVDGWSGPWWPLPWSQLAAQAVWRRRSALNIFSEATLRHMGSSNLDIHVCRILQLGQPCLERYHCHYMPVYFFKLPSSRAEAATLPGQNGSWSLNEC